MLRRVLIVDDEPDVCVYLRTILEQHGYAVEIASSVDAAEALLKKARPDVACLDIMMPKRSGMKLYEYMRASRRLRSVPVIIISGVVPTNEFEMRQFINDSQVPGPDGYLEKPIKIDEFVGLIERLTAPGPGSKTPGGSSHG